MTPRSTPSIPVEPPQKEPWTYDEDGRPHRPEWLPPVPGETTKEAVARRRLNRMRQGQWDLWTDQRCERCGEARLHVNHEPNPATSIEGPDYYADFLDELHPFVEPSR